VNGALSVYLKEKKEENGDKKYVGCKYLGKLKRRVLHIKQRNKFV